MKVNLPKTQRRKTAVYRIMKKLLTRGSSNMCSSLPDISGVERFPADRTIKLPTTGKYGLECLYVLQAKFARTHFYTFHAFKPHFVSAMFAHSQSLENVVINKQEKTCQPVPHLLIFYNVSHERNLGMIQVKLVHN